MNERRRRRHFPYLLRRKTLEERKNFHSRSRNVFFSRCEEKGEFRTIPKYEIICQNEMKSLPLLRAGKKVRNYYLILLRKRWRKGAGNIFKITRKVPAKRTSKNENGSEMARKLRTLFTKPVFSR